MSKRKADFDTPEKENKLPKTSGTLNAARSYREKWKNGNPWLRYDAKSKLMFCDYVLSLNVRISSRRDAVFLKKNLCLNMLHRRVRFVLIWLITGLCNFTR